MPDIRAEISSFSKQSENVLLLLLRENEDIKSMLKGEWYCNEGLQYDYNGQVIEKLKHKESKANFQNFNLNQKCPLFKFRFKFTYLVDKNL